MNNKSRLLAISYAYPPFSYPRAIQVSRLVSALDAETTVLCADDPEARRDLTIMPKGHKHDIVPVPFHIGPIHKILRRLREHLGISLPLLLPDPCIFWIPAAIRAATTILAEQRPDALVTFGMPMSDHLLGLALKNKYRLPWIAHFSDPWADNPYIRFSPASHWINRKLEALIMRHADTLVFTNRETVSLVMDKYPVSIRHKAEIIPHAYDPSRYSREKASPDIIIRHIGALYGLRSPVPFLSALRAILESTPSFLEGIRFEFIGPIEDRLRSSALLDEIESGYVSFREPVDYQESLDLMATAHGLLMIDAPMDTSPFFPSKLADYFGAGRPVLAITPEGPTKRLITENAFGFTASADNDASIREALLSFLQLVKSGLPIAAPKAYCVETVANDFKKVVLATISAHHRGLK